MWFWQEAAAWPDFGALTRRLAEDESALRQKLWRKLKHDRQMLILEHHAVNWRDYRAARVNAK